MLALLLLYGSAFAQQRYTLSGTLKDARNSETLINALVTVEGKPELGTITNEYGFYSLTLPAGYYSIIYSYVGYTADTVKLSLGQNIVKNVALKSQSRELKDVVVKQVKENNNITTAQMGVEKLNMAEINKLPVLLGERDVLKTIQLLPGIKSAGEGNSGFNVRGGTTDQNLILLDEAPVYNAAHLLGFSPLLTVMPLKTLLYIKERSPRNTEADWLLC